VSASSRTTATSFSKFRIPSSAKWLRSTGCSSVCAWGTCGENSRPPRPYQRTGNYTPRLAPQEPDEPTAGDNPRYWLYYRDGDYSYGNGSISIHNRSTIRAWLGLVPPQNSSSGEDRLGRISKMGNQYLRRLLVVGATALIGFARNRTTPLAARQNSLACGGHPHMDTTKDSVRYRHAFRNGISHRKRSGSGLAIKCQTKPHAPKTLGCRSVPSSAFNYLT
jgi:hypothetical protein